MKLQTEIKLKKQEHNQIDYHSNLLLLGSCFSENIGDKFDYFKFQNISNPFGILFHIKAIENLVVRAVENNKYSEKDLFFHNEQWHCFDAHSQLSNTSKEELIENLNLQLKIAQNQIVDSTHIIITLGTAWVYDYIENGKSVANCHKMPQKHFDKRILSIKEITESIQNCLEAIQKLNTKTSILFTVSPVRHIKDGFVENTQSKSHLISAIHSVLSSQTKLKESFYFPSYEIMLDELRDYRFYKSDMLHPNETAIEYIWQKFQQVWINDYAIETMSEVDTIQKGLLHKPFNKNSQAHLKFIESLNSKIRTLKSKFINIDF